MKKQRTVLLVAVIVGALIKFFVPAANGLTEAGVNLIAVFVPTIILWLVCDTGWTSLLSCVALAFMAVAKGDTVFMTMYGNSVCVRVIALSIIAAVMTDNGATDWIARWFISRKIVHGRPYMYIFLSAIVVIILGFVVSGVLLIMLFAALNESVAISIGYDRKSTFFKATTMFNFFVATWADAISPFGRTISTAVLAIMSSLGYDISPLQWMSFTIPFAIIGTLAGMLVIMLVYKPEMSNFKRYDDEAIRRDLKDNPMTKTGKFSVCLVIATLILWVMPSLSFLPDGLTNYFGQLGTGASVNLMVVALCIIPIDGKPAIELKDALNKVNWKLIIFIGTVMFFATYLGSDTYGIKAVLVNVLGPVASKIPLVLIIIVCIFLTAIVTNFMSNTVTASVIVSVFAPVLILMNVEPKLIIALVCGVSMMADAAMCTLAGSPVVGVCMNEDTVPYKESVPTTLVFTLTLAVISCAMVFIYGM